MFEILAQELIANKLFFIYKKHLDQQKLYFSYRNYFFHPSGVRVIKLVLDGAAQ